MNILSFKKVLTAAAFAGAIMASSVSHAAIINNMFQTGVNGAQDTDRDRVLDSSGNTVSSGAWAIGDTIQSALQFNTIEWLDSTGATIQSTQIYTVEGVNYGLYAVANAVITGISNIYAGDGVTVIGNNLTFGGSTLISLYEGNITNPFGAGVTPATAISNISGLPTLATFGISSSNDFWTATVGTDITSLANGYGQTQQAAGVFGLSMLSNPGGLPVGPNGVLGADGLYHDIVGNASAYGSGGTTGWLASTNTTVYFATPVPEPGSLALLGIGGLLFSIALKRRQSV
jgi:hypothetical protein